MAKNEAVFEAAETETVDDRVVDREPVKMITDLDVVCIERILKLLSVKDLLAFGQTCSLYKKLTEEYFQLKPKFNHPITTSIENGRVQFDFSSKHGWQILQKRFPSLCQDWIVEMENSLVTEIFQFVNENCATQLKYLNLWSREHFELGQCDGAIIAEQLKQLKVLQLNSFITFKGDFYARFLKYCEQLNALTIICNQTKLEPPFIMDTTWMNYSYGRLTVLHIICNKSTSVYSEFPDFLRNNPQLKVVVTNQNSIIKSLCLAEMDLEYAAFLFTSERDVLLLMRDLEICNEQKFDKTIELIFCTFVRAIGPIFNLKKFKRITWTSSDSCRHLEIISCLFQPQSHIEAVDLRFKTMASEVHKDVIISEILKLFPRLKKLEFHSRIYPETPFKKVFLPLLAGLGSLEDLCIGHTFPKIKLLESDIIDAHTERLKLNHSSPVTVQFFASSVEYNGTIRDTTLVKIKLLEGYDCSHCPMDNRYKLRSIHPKVYSSIYED